MSREVKTLNYDVSKAKKNIKKLAIDNNIFLKDIAVFLGLNYTSFSYKINGKSEFAISEIINLLNLFNVDFEKIFLQGDSSNKGTKEA